MNRLLIVFLYIVFMFQSGHSVAQSRSLPEMEAALLRQFELLKAASTDSIQLSVCQEISTTLKTALEQGEAAFKYPFDTLKMLGKIQSDDQLVRIFTWNIELSDHSFRYFGFIHYYHKDKKQYLVYELNDESENIRNPENSALTERKWYGALYYEIVETKYKGEKFYTLLGWDGYDLFTDKRLIDVLTFTNNGRPKFNSAIFEKDQRKVRRVIFQHAENTAMTLRYDSQLNMIVFDHLSPSNPAYEGNYEYYGPDFSYDAYEFNKGVWQYVTDVNPQNDNK